MKNPKRYLPLLGIIGVSLTVIILFVTAEIFRSPTGSRYSITNHYISELGYGGISELNLLFDFGLMIIGILFAIFIYGVSFYFKGKSARIIGILGISSGLFCSLVGLFPMNLTDQHQIVTAGFFGSFTIMSIFYLVLVLKQFNCKLSKFTTIPSFLVIISSIGFSYYIFGLNVSLTPGESNIIRPDLWQPALLEWSLLFSLILWVLAVSADLFNINRKNV